MFRVKVVYLWSHCREKQCSEWKVFTFGHTAERSSVLSERCLPLVKLPGEAVFQWKLFTFGQTAGGLAFNLTDMAVACYLLITSPQGGWRCPMSLFNLSGIQGCHLIWSPFLSTPLFFYLFPLLVLLVPFVLMVQSFFLSPHENCPIYFVKRGFLGYHSCWAVGWQHVTIRRSYLLLYFTFLFIISGLKTKLHFSFIQYFFFF